MSKFIDLTAYGDVEKVILLKKSSIDGIVVNDYGIYIVVAIHVNGNYYNFKFKDIEQADEFYKHVMKEIENE